MWKKTGAWFFKGIPRYEIPQRSPAAVRASVREIRVRPTEEKPVKLEIKSADSSSEDDDEDDIDTATGAAATVSQEYNLLKDDTPKKMNGKGYYDDQSLGRITY